MLPGGECISSKPSYVCQRIQSTQMQSGGKNGIALALGAAMMHLCWKVDAFNPQHTASLYPAVERNRLHSSLTLLRYRVTRFPGICLRDPKVKYKTCIIRRPRIARPSLQYLHAGTGRGERTRLATRSRRISSNWHPPWHMHLECLNIAKLFITDANQPERQTMSCS
jgi:hypothetical protein